MTTILDPPETVVTPVGGVLSGRGAVRRTIRCLALVLPSAHALRDTMGAVILIEDVARHVL